MNGTLKSVLALSGLWVGSVVAWLVVVGIAAGAAGRGTGSSLTLAMGAAWGSALVFALAAVALGKSALWAWLPPGGLRVVLLLVAAAAQCLAFGVQVMSVFVIFNR